MQDEKKILRERALQLAKGSKEIRHTEESAEVLSFQLGGEIYAFETTYIQGVLSLKDITPLPLTPAFLKGIMNIRGEIISVIDIRVFFGLSEAGISDLNRVILLQMGEMKFGILADRILDVTFVSLKNLHTGLLTLKGIREEYLKGVSASPEMIILDAGRILADKRLIIHEEF